MPIVFEDDLRKDIKTKNFSPVYLIYGDDSYLKNYYKDQLATNASDGDPFFNLQKFESNFEFQEAFDAINQFPMMAMRKSVVISDFDFEHASKADYDRFIELISSANDTCVLIICFDAIEFDAKKGSKEKKIISTIEKSGGKVAEINHRSITALVKILSDGAKKRGCNFGEIAARHLIETAGSDLSTLKNELDKLCSYVGAGEISKDAVNQISVKSIDASVYEYVKCILAGNVSAALTQLDDMFFMRIEPIIILSVTATSYIDIYRAYVSNIAGKRRDDIATDFKYAKNKLFLIDRAIQSARSFDAKKLRLSLNEIASADKLLKSFGVNPRSVLEQLTVKLIYISVKGENVD